MKTKTLALLFFAWLMIGAKDAGCDPWAADDGDDDTAGPTLCQDMGQGAGGAGADSSGAGGSEVGSGGSDPADPTPQDGTVSFCLDPCSAQCLTSPPTMGMGLFDPSAFVFVTIVADDGEGLAGGWQQSIATLRFVPEDGASWTCTETVGMPLRAEAFGKISPTDAATLTAAFANQAWRKVRKESQDLPSGIFCSTFTAEMVALFKAPMYKPLGARVTGRSP